MPSSHGRRVAVAVFVFGLFVSPYAYAADTSAFGISDPFIDALQLWVTVFASIESVAHQLTVALQPQPSLSLNRSATPHAPKNLAPSSLAASAVLAIEPLALETATTSASASAPFITPQQPQVTSPPATADVSIVSASQQALAVATPASDFVTQEQFNEALSALGTSVRQLLTPTIANPVPEYVAGDGNNANPYAAAGTIDQLDNTTITNPTITGGNVTATSFSGLLAVGDGGTGISATPSYGQLLVGNSSGTYTLIATSSLGIVSGGGAPGGSDMQVQFDSGGAFVGSSNFTFSSSTSKLMVTNASTTNFTSSYASTTNLVATNATSTDLFATLGNFTTGIFNSLSASVANITGLTATNATTTNLAVMGSGIFSGNVGIGTTSPSQILSVQGSEYLSGNLNINSGNSYQIGGSAVLSSSTLTFNSAKLTVGPVVNQSYGTSTVQSQFWGVNARAAYPLASDSGFGTIGIGAGAFQSLLTLGGENICIGPLAGQFATSTTLVTCMGMHALGSQVSGPGFTVYGDDAMRDAIGTSGYVSAFGESAVAHGGPQTVTAFGSQAARGNSSAATLSGTLTNGDVLSLTLSSSVSGLTGLPLTASHTVAGGDTLASIASALANQINNKITGPSYQIGASVQGMPDGTQVIWFAFPGNIASGWAITITPSVTGAQTETLTLSNGANGNQIDAFGSNAVLGVAMQPSVYAITAFGDNTGEFITTAEYLALSGYSSGQDLTSASADAFYGPLSAPVATTASNDSGVGFWAFKSLTTGNGDDALGRQACSALTTGSNDLCLGYTVGSNTLASGNGNILIGSGANTVDTPAAGTSNFLDIGNLIYGTNLGTNGAPAGNIGIGTTTPYSRLEVWGPDTASTSAFTVVNSASTTEFSVYDTGNAILAGSLTQNSDQRLKTNIQSLAASSSLAAIDALNPVTFNWIDPNKGSTPQLGFIAQQVLPIFPNLVSTTSATALTPDGTLSLNYIDLISPIVSAIQALSADIASIENTIASFAQSFTTHQLNADELCLDGTCINQQQLAAVLASASQSPAGNSSSSSGNNSASSTPDTPPVIKINGDNPALVQFGAAYNDLGATITGPQADLNLGITTYVNGTEMNPVQIDTSATATDTIDYVVTDGQGLAATSTRTVIVEAPSIVPTDDASSTAATSTAQ